MEYRKRLWEQGIIDMDGKYSASRLVHELGDGLTGLTIDIYGQCADIQVYSAFWNEMIPTIK